MSDKPASGEKLLYCSFCGKSQHEVSKLIAGPSVFIHGLATAVLIIMALALFVSGYNGIMFSLSGSVRAVSAISSISMVFLAILGGGFFPTEFTPPAFQAITKLIPTGMVNLGLTHCLTGRPLGISLPVLFLYCGAFFVVGTLMGRRRIL